MAYFIVLAIRILVTLPRVSQLRLMQQVFARYDLSKCCERA